MRFLLITAILLGGSVAAQGEPIEWAESEGGNGHFYEVINVSNTWYLAETAAGIMTHEGLDGHLATVTSQDEWNFLVANFVIPEATGLWIGGFQPEGSPEPDGGWTWITGEAWDYTNWRSGEPNNSPNFGNEDGIEIRLSGWNDFVRTGTRPGFVVEYGENVTPVGNQTTSVTMLYSSVPNPFNPATEISFEMAVAGHARLSVYDISGRLVQTLLDDLRTVGRHTVTWDGRDDVGHPAATGIYLYRLEAGDYAETKRMTLIK